MSGNNDSDSSTSESEVSACSSNFNPLKALYSSKAKIPVKNAPLYENIQQYEASQKYKEVLPVGLGEEVKRREESKAKAKMEQDKQLEEKNKQRFANFTGLVPTKERRYKNVLTRIEKMEGPLSILKECVDKRLRIKDVVAQFVKCLGRGFESRVALRCSCHVPHGDRIVVTDSQPVTLGLNIDLRNAVITRNETGVRGYIHATLVAFDKQWNLALTDVLEVWKRKGVTKRKIPPGLGTPVEKGTAAKLSPVPTVTEKAIGGGLFECTRHCPQLLVRGEHVVIVNVVDR